MQAIFATQTAIARYFYQFVNKLNETIVQKVAPFIVSIAIFETPIAVVFTYQGYAIWLGLVLLLSVLGSCYLPVMLPV